VSSSRTDLTLRLAGEEDWPLIWPFFEHIVRAGDTYCYRTDLASEPAKRDWFDQAEVWLAADARTDEVLGTYHLAPNRDGPGAHVANASYMVSTDSRGRGVGRTMVEHSLVRAAQVGYRAVQFNAVVETNVVAIKLYEELGFSIVGRVPEAFAHPVEGYVDLVIMHKSLVEPD